jgi:hypothetical protein
MFHVEQRANGTRNYLRHKYLRLNRVECVPVKLLF